MVPIQPFNISMWIAVAVAVLISTIVLRMTSQTTARLLGLYELGLLRYWGGLTLRKKINVP
jgi:hypothetical protein